MEQQEKLRRMLTYAALLYAIGFAFCLGVTAIQLDAISAAFRLPEALEGTVNTVNSIGSVAALVSVLFLQGRVKKSVLLSVSGLTLSACLLLKGLVPSYLLLLVAFCLFGIAIGYADCYLNAFIVDLNGANSGRYLGALHAVSGVGCTIAPLVITWIRSGQTWQNTYLVMAAVTAVPFAAFALLCRRGKPVLTGSVPEVRLHWADIREYLTRRNNLAVMGSMFLYMMFFSALTYWTPLYTERVLGAPELRAYPLAAFWGCAAVSRFLAPRLGVSEKKIYLLGTAGGILVMALGVLTSRPGLMIAAWGLSGLLTGPSVPTLISMGCAAYRDRSSLPTSLLVIMMYAANGVSPMLMAAVSAAASLRESLLLSAAFGLAAAAAGLLIRED